MAIRRSLLLAVLFLGICADTCKGQELRCQCVETHSDFIPPKFITLIQLIPEGPYCSRKEVIVTLADGKLVCLDPKEEWVTTIIKEIMNRTGGGHASVSISRRRRPLAPNRIKGTQKTLKLLGTRPKNWSPNMVRLNIWSPNTVVTTTHDPRSLTSCASRALSNMSLGFLQIIFVSSLYANF